MRLNLGCGDRYASGWWNVDRADMPFPKDEAFDLRTGELPWRDLEYVYAGHVLEHMFVDEVIVLLLSLRDCMAPEGELMVVGPDVVCAREMAEAGTLGVTMESLENGGHRWPGDEHRWHCTKRAVKSLLLSTGWTPTAVGIANVPEFWPVADRGPQWQCAVSARVGWAR